jgi:hypothetical protein
VYAIYVCTSIHRLDLHRLMNELCQELAYYGFYQFMSRLKALLYVEVHESKNVKFWIFTQLYYLRNGDERFRWLRWL